ncbi:hypothetical protein PhaeoP24_04267 (plasmid) [Phaeobacter inhibens]|uniref:hypothetical protein n=1 Tax=Phaeobacter inhibens TaxID=221822 RepID=UPI000CA10337|nr:hypothetical protein [Phaeobacter inhibens]AUQ92825.1 hypothetical protein PhaeoP24_04267 [Phaeobacter inhibens]
MSEAVNYPIEVKTMPAAKAPMMLHEQVASGEYGGEDFTVIRSVTGLDWQVRIGETTAAFSLNDALQSIVTGVVDDNSN